MHWIFLSVKGLEKLVGPYYGRKSRGQEAEFQKGFEKNEHACRVEGVLRVLDCTAPSYLKVACLTWKIQSYSKLLSCSYSSESDKQKSQTHSWGSLVMSGIAIYVLKIGCNRDIKILNSYSCNLLFSGLSLAKVIMDIIFCYILPGPLRYSNWDLKTLQWRAKFNHTCG